MVQSTEPSAEETQLLSKRTSLVAVEGENEVRKESIGAKFFRWSLGAVASAAAFYFVVLYVAMPTKVGTWLLSSLISRIVSGYYGMSGAFLLVFGGPVFVIVAFGVLYLYLFPRSSRRPVTRKAPRASLGTHPVIVSGPFGVVSAAELLSIVVFVCVMTWWLFMTCLSGFSEPAHQQTEPSVRWYHYLAVVGVRLGFVGQVCLSLLFIPVARGSVLLRLIDIPFEHAAKYHVWLGHFTMAIFSLHGLAFVILWAARGHLIAKLLEWESYGIANLPGVISLVAGLFMWMTSFQFTRINAFELFFYTHQLYIIFIIFMAFHVGDVFFQVCFAGIFLFTFDRFLRFCQSRKDVLALSARVLPCGTFEVVLPKPSNLQYNALSFIFLNIPALGPLQWHPFSTSSSPKDSPDNIKFLIKPLGTWTRQLNEAISKAATSKCPLSLKTGVEGPYGHETSYFLDYEALLLVAGGIGVSPFIAIIRDLLQRYKSNEPYLPKDVTLIWAVKHREELAILDSLSPMTIYPEYASKFSLTLKAYVTKEVEGDLEAGEEKNVSHTDLVSCTQSAEYNPAATQKAISHLVGSGPILWVGAATGVSFLGYLVVTGLVGKFYLLPVDHNSYKVVPWWVRGGIVCLCIVFGVWFFGGSIILLWHLVNSRSTKKQYPAAAEPLLKDSHEVGDEISVEKLVQRSNTVYGRRPDLQEVFEGCAKRLSGSNIGVLVCGPEGLQTNVATQCRAFNTVHYSQHNVAFSYHSVSFDL